MRHALEDLSWLETHHRCALIAIFYVNLKTFSRAKGQSAVAAAAYRVGTQAGFRDERTGILHTYGRKRGIVSVGIHLPNGAPAWARDPEKLWNNAEAAEKRINSRVAFEWIVALPAELSVSQRAALVADLCDFLVERYAVATMAAIHAPDIHGDQRNHHVHLMTSTRIIGPDGFGAKVRTLVDQQTGPREIEAVRALVAALTNQYLERAGSAERVDHQRLLVQAKAAEDQGEFAKAVMLTREATIHEGQAATAACRRGDSFDRSAWNDSVREDNAQALADFLAMAQAEGRVLATPSRSDLAQARMDRTREATNETNETNETPTAIQATTSTSRISRVRSSGGRGVRQRLATRSGAATRAEGKDAALLNAAAAQANEVRRTEGEMSQKYVDMIQGIVEEFGQRATNAVAYARMLQWPFLDMRALAQHTARDPSCGPLLGQALQADAVWQRAQTLAARRRERYGNAMVATVCERQAVDRMEQSTEPPHWKKRSRREWAEFRRKERARLERARRREKRAQSLVSEHAMSGYVTKVRNARASFDHIERQRRERYPVPCDLQAVQPSTTVRPSPDPRASRPAVRSHRERRNLDPRPLPVPAAVLLDEIGSVPRRPRP